MTGHSSSAHDSDKTEPTSRVVIVCDHFPPSERAGGPSRSIFGIVASEMSTHDIEIVTRDHDIGGEPAYTQAQVETADAKIPTVQVRRIARRHQYFHLYAAMRRTVSRQSTLYLNSLLSPAYTLLPLALVKFKLVHPRKILLAPRGELSRGALAVKKFKKRIATPIIRSLTADPRLEWHASSSREADDISRFIRARRQDILVQANPAPDPTSNPDYPKNVTLKVAFIARMAPIKNFLLLAHAAQLIDFPITIVVAGALEDESYWEQCIEQLKSSGDAVQVDVRGHQSDDQIVSLLNEVDAMVLPTFGENFGRSIAEALSRGCPVMIPDTTLWTPYVLSGAGWLIDTDDPKVLVSALADLSEANSSTRRKIRQNTLSAYSQWWNAEQERQRSLFA